MGKGGVERKEEDVSVRAEERERDGEKKNDFERKKNKKLTLPSLVISVYVCTPNPSMCL
jgi:hypothetical protein